MYGSCLYTTVMPKNNVSVRVKGTPRQWISDRSDVQCICKCMAFGCVGVGSGRKRSALCPGQTETIMTIVIQKLISTKP